MQDEELKGQLEDIPDIPDDIETLKEATTLVVIRKLPKLITSSPDRRTIFNRRS